MNMVNRLQSVNENENKAEQMEVENGVDTVKRE